MPHSFRTSSAKGRVNHLQQLLISAGLTIGFVAIFAADLANAACGSLDSVYHEYLAVNKFNDDILLNPGDQLYSCSGIFRLTYESNNVVLYHTPSGQNIWSEPADGGEFSFYNYEYLDVNTRYPARLVVQDNGNLEVLRDTGDGSETIEWTSDTQGTDCTQAFVTESTRIELAARVESSDADAANVVRDNVCSLFKVVAYESGGFSQDIAAETAGPAVLRGRTVINEYKYVLTGFYGGYYLEEFPIGSARLQKTWYYDGSRVSNSAGRDPDKATLEGDASIPAQVLGYSWVGPTSGSEVDAFSLYNGNGQGAHYSARTAQIKWEVPVAGTLVSFKPMWQQKLYIKGFSDGKVECRGGTNCLNAENP